MDHIAHLSCASDSCGSDVSRDRDVVSLSQALIATDVAPTKIFPTTTPTVGVVA